MQRHLLYITPPSIPPSLPDHRAIRHKYIHCKYTKHVALSQSDHGSTGNIGIQWKWPSRRSRRAALSASAVGASRIRFRLKLSCVGVRWRHLTERKRLAAYPPPPPPPPRRHTHTSGYSWLRSGVAVSKGLVGLRREPPLF